MKFLSTKEMNKIAKSTLALVLAGTFTFSSSLVSAAEKTDDTEKYETVVLDNETSENTATENKDTNVTEVNQETKDDAAELEKPSLVPGNFFYFAKIALEKIKLALTFDDEKEAKLLAEFAAERLAEAEALLAEQKEDEALEVIKTALETLTKAEDKTEVNKDENKDEIKDENKDESATEQQPSVEEDVNKEQAKDEDSVTEETSKDEVVVEDEVTVENPADEMDELISQNIIALKAALEKVKNPVAKAALQKNIDKSYARLAKKLEYLNKKYELNKETELGVKEENTDEQVSNQDDATENTEKTSQEAVKEDQTAVSPEKIEQENTDKTKLDEKAAKAEVKQARQEEKQQVKQAREEMKQQVKQTRTEIKEERKQQHEAVKQEAKQARAEVKQQHKEMKQEVKQERAATHNQNNGHQKGQIDKENGKNN